MSDDLPWSKNGQDPSKRRKKKKTKWTKTGKIVGKPVRDLATTVALPPDVMKFLELASLATGKSRVQLIKESVMKYIRERIDIDELLKLEQDAANYDREFD